MPPLSKKQKAVICQLAARAYKQAGAAMGYDSVAEFRHASVQDASGKSGLTSCDQLDYIPIYNYLAGMLDMPLKTDKTPKDAHARALWVLKDSMARFELSEAYVVSIAMARLGLTALTPPSFAALAPKLDVELLRQLNYTVINRGRAKARKIEQQHGLPPSVEVHTSANTLPPKRMAEYFNAHTIKQTKNKA